MKLNRREALAALGVGVLVSTVEARDTVIPDFILPEDLERYAQDADPRFYTTVDFNTVLGDTIKEKYDSIVMILAFTSNVVRSNQIIFITSPEVGSLFETNFEYDPITKEFSGFQPASSDHWKKYGNKPNYLAGTFEKSIKIQETSPGEQPREVEFCPKFHLYKHTGKVLPVNQFILKDAGSNRLIKGEVKNFII